MKTAIELARLKRVTREAIYGHARRSGIKPNADGKYTESDAKKILARIGSKPGPKTGSRRKRAA